MKKLLALLLAAVMVLSLAACGGSTEPTATTAAAAATDATEAAEIDRAAAEAEIRYALSLRWRKFSLMKSVRPAESIRTLISVQTVKSATRCFR